MSSSTELSAPITSPIFDRVMHKLHNDQGRMVECLLQAGGNISEAARNAKVARRSHYNWINADEYYRMAVRLINETLTECLESVALDRALNGWVEPVFHKGRQVGKVRKYDNNLLWRLLESGRKHVVEVQKQREESVEYVERMRQEFMVAIEKFVGEHKRKATETKLPVDGQAVDNAQQPLPLEDQSASPSIDDVDRPVAGQVPASSL